MSHKKKIATYKILFQKNKFATILDFVEFFYFYFSTNKINFSILTLGLVPNLQNSKGIYVNPSVVHFQRFVWFCLRLSVGVSQFALLKKGRRSQNSQKRQQMAHVNTTARVDAHADDLTSSGGRGECPRRTSVNSFRTCYTSFSQVPPKQRA